MSVSGKAIEATPLDPDIVVLGAMRIGPVPIAARPSATDPKGVVGMDVLDELVVVLSPAGIRNILVIAKKNDAPAQTPR